MKQITSITFFPINKEMTVGSSRFFYPTILPVGATNKCLEWSSSNEDVAVANKDSGLITALQTGTTRIRADATDGSDQYGFFDLTVIFIKVKTIKIKGNKNSLRKGETCKLSVDISPSNATKKSVRWRSDNPLVASVDEYTGLVTAKSAGTTTIHVTAQDGSAVSSSCTICVKQTTDSSEDSFINKILEALFADPVDVYTGAHLMDNTIMSLFGGQNVKLVAHYNSTQLGKGMLGYGWYHDFEKYICVSNDEILVYNTPTVFSRYTADNNSSTKFICDSPSKNGYVLTIDQSNQYPYIIDCNSEKTEYYNSNGKIAKIKDHQGFETTITYSDYLITITDVVSGKKIYLEKDSTNKVVRVYDDAERHATLTYTNDLLVGICDVNNNELKYTYDQEKRIVSGTDFKGTRYFENTYDDYGRVSQQKDALNHTSYFNYSDNECESIHGDTRITTNRNEKSSTRIYNADGLLIKHIDENGKVKCYEYDEFGNVTKEIDANGHSLIKTYNSFNKPLTVRDKNGKLTSFTYDSKGNVTKITYPEVEGGIPTETFVYNSRNQMTQHTDIRGTTTVYTYDANGMPATKKVGAKNAILYSYENGLLKSQTDSLNYTTRYAHNTIGQVISKTDADNKVTQYEYDNSGNLLKTIDANGKSIVTIYDGNYQKTAVTDANGNTTSYSYNGNLKNDVITLPDGHTMKYAFDREDRTVKVTDQLNKETIITYDDAGRVLSKRFPDGATIQYQYDAVGQVIKETNPKGAVTTKTYDKNGNVLSVTDDEDNKTTYEYNAMNKVTKMTNAVAGSTVYLYSKAGDLLSETDALGNTKTYTYDAFGNRLTATDAKNNVTTYTYDQNNNLLTVKDALGHITTYAYNSLNQCVSVKDALDNVIYYGYDALGRRTTITDARGNVFTTHYDGNGNVIKTTDAKGNTISETVYNALNKPLTVTDAMGKSTTYTYNELGLVKTVTDSMNHVSQYTYNSRGQNTVVCDAINGESKAVYDLLGNVTRLEGPLGGATTYTYDDMGRLSSESTVSGGTKSYEYNELNIRNKVTNARGQIRKFFYDAMGKITGYKSPEGDVSYTYDVNGNVLTVSDIHGTITRTYDALNRVSTYADTYGKVIRYEYDAVGNLSRLTYPDNTAVTYEYDANHNLVKVTDWANRVTSYTYDVNNRVVGVTKPDGSVTTTVYDNKQRVVSTVERTSSGAIITGFEYIYDDLSRIIEEKHLDKNCKLCYTYDNLSRVTARTVKKLSDNSVVSTEAFNYDAAGNVTSAPDSSFQYDTNNRLISFNGNTVSYDLDGNMLSNGSIICTYDSANRLVSGGGHTYTYNAEDVRIRNLCSDADTFYTYDVNCKLSRLLQKTTNTHTTKYVYGIGLIGEEKKGQFKTYHFDSRGSTIAITDESGNITDTFEYNAYGKLINRTGESFVIFGYNGRDGVVTDKNGLIYMRARYYSPEMKRFINADVVSGEISNAITLNRFAYANGNPVSFVDPFGLSPDKRDGTTESLWEYAKKRKPGMDFLKSLAEGAYICSEGFYIEKRVINGVEKIIIHGSNAFVHSDDVDIWQRIINADNISKYPNIQKHLNPKLAAREAVSSYADVFKGTSKNTLDYLGVAGDIIVITGDTIMETYQYEDWEDKALVGGYTIVTGAASAVASTATSAAVSVSVTAGIAKIGGTIGTAFAPGVGTVIGALAGIAVGLIVDGIFKWGREKYIDKIVENN